MIKIRYRQRWHEFTCECDHNNNWRAFVQVNAEKPVVIENIICKTCSYLFAGEGKEFEKFRMSVNYINVPTTLKVIGNDYLHRYREF